MRNRIIFLAGISFLAPVRAVASGPGTRYLAFQIFTGSFDSVQLRQSFPPAPGEISEAVDGLVRAIGTTGNKDRRLGFIVGPLAFDNKDEDVRRLIRRSFWLAREKNIAVGFHIDDSMFWGRLSQLKTPENIEWTDWNATASAGRRLDWSSKPLKIMPQLCFNSPAVLSAVNERAALIGQEVAEGAARLAADGKSDLFLGVIVGWETMIGRDFDTGQPLGYHALSRKGFGPKNSREELDRAREDVVRDFIDFWAAALAKNGVPETRIYSHIAFTSKPLFDLMSEEGSSYSEASNFTPPRVAFGKSHYAGFSTYPMSGHLEELRAELKDRGDPPWASCEGTAIDPLDAERGGGGMSMEAYLGNLFNHGASVVNVFGWNIGSSDNPFRRTVDSPDSLAAYRKFLQGGTLTEATIPMPNVPTKSLRGKAQRFQKILPGYIKKHGPSQVAPLIKKFEGCLKNKEFSEAEKAADEILQMLDSFPQKGSFQAP